MEHRKRPAGVRWLLLTALALTSFVITGCEKGSLGVKEGAIRGYVFDTLKNTPIADVYITAKNHDGTIRDAMTGGDGGYLIAVPPLENPTWTLKGTKFGYVASESADPEDPFSVMVGNGQTVNAPILRLTKTLDTTKGMLKGYPVDAVTGLPLKNFTVTQISPSRFKTFDTAQEFKDNGWNGLEGGVHQYKITCANYVDYITAAPDTMGETADEGPPQVSITASPFNLGVVKMNPLRVSIAGTVRNLPGYILSQSNTVPAAAANIDSWSFWAEASGRVVASHTAQPGGDVYQGTIRYTLNDIPVTVGAITVKCKIRGYDVVTLSPLNIPATRPSGTIDGVDFNFANIEPIRRDVRLVIQSDSVDPDSAVFKPGETARVWIRQGGRDMAPYVDTVCNDNFWAEAYFTNVITGYPIEFFVLNTNRGANSTGLQTLILEDGGTVMTLQIRWAYGPDAHEDDDPPSP